MTSSPVSPRHSSVAPRLAGLEAARFLAAGAIIWIHAAESPQGISLTSFCRFAVPFFTALIVVLTFKSSVQLTQKSSLLAYTAQRLTRLYVPFLIWSLLYLGLRAVKHLYAPHSSPIIINPATLLNGTTHHLWFLPFALLVSVGSRMASVRLHALSALTSKMVGVVALVSAIIVGVMPCPMPMDVGQHPLSYFVGLSWDALPAALMAISVVTLTAGAQSGLLLWCGAIGFAASLVAFGLWGAQPLVAAVSGNGLLVASSAICLPDSFAALARKVGALSFGIYLVHVAFIEPLQVISRMAAISPTLLSDAVIAVLSLMLSVVCVLLLHRSETGRFILPR